MFKILLFVIILLFVVGFRYLMMFDKYWAVKEATGKAMYYSGTYKIETLADRGYTCLTIALILSMIAIYIS